MASKRKSARPTVERLIERRDRLRVTTAHVYVGLRPGSRARFEDEDGRPVKLQLPLDFEYSPKQVEEITLRHFYGATMEQAVGVWRDERVGIIRETSVVITLINCCSWKQGNKQFTDQVFDLARDLYDELQQDSILVQIIEQDTDDEGEVELQTEFYEVT